LRFIVLADTGKDVSQCAACECCYVDEAVRAKFDLELWEVLAAARDNDQVALTNRTIWSLAEARPEDVRCPNEVDVVAIAQALCREARLRELAPQPEGAGTRKRKNVKREV
jgi:heterodisulfide reductase subunit C